jgi:asparagine synthase (glutamine-hydrolysing)
MCGFAGILNDSKLSPKHHVATIASCVSFRGPDSTGVKIFNEYFESSETGNNAFFFNRLAIIDLDARADQPFENDRYLLLFNGEIYNYKQLRQKLEGYGTSFRTTSDTEVLFYLLIRFGKEALSLLNGMFSLFFIDKAQGKFILSRDRLGIKPMYYAQYGSSLAFGSELKSVLRLHERRFDISARSVEMYLWMQYIPTPYTPFEGIFKLPPGHYIEGTIDELKAGVQFQSKSFWDAYEFLIQTEVASDPDELEDILKESLASQLNADVPLGLFLSSGIDSSLLASLVHKYFSFDRVFNFFTIAFRENTAKDESLDAQQFIQGFKNANLKNHLLTIDPSVIGAKLESLYQYVDEPFADSAVLLNWAISEKAREHVTVVISGDGADELFWGYPRYNLWQKFTQRASLLLAPQFVNHLAGQLPEGRLKHNSLFASEPDPIQRHLNLFLPSGMRFLIQNSILKYPMWASGNLDGIRKREDLPALLDLKMYLPDAMLYKVDRSSMASSLEVRVPYLDNNVVDFSLALPFRYKSNAQFQNKAILKSLLMKLAPHYDISLTKKGFGFPLESWMRKQWKDKILSTISEDSLSDLGLDPKPFRRIVNDFYHRGGRHYTDVWYLFNLSLWLEQFKSEMKFSIPARP